MKRGSHEIAKSGESCGIGVAKSVAMPNWPRVENLLGETLREVGILILVFAPLETAFSDRPTGALVVIGTVAFSLGLIAAGILVEARR